MKRKLAAAIEDAEESACIRAYDIAKASGGTPVPYEQVLKKMERRREKISQLKKGTKSTTSQSPGATN
jgi:hypothetical protein